MRRPPLPVDTHYQRVTGRLGILPRSLSTQQAHILLRSRLPSTWTADEMEKRGSYRWRCLRSKDQSLSLFNMLVGSIGLLDPGSAFVNFELLEGFPFEIYPYPICYGAKY